MILMITLEQVKIIREKKKDNPDQMNLFGNNDGKKKKYTPPSKEKSDAIQARSANRDAKKYASGEYAKIGGGERMSPKSKGPGASTGGSNTPPATVGGKNKGTTPVKVNITKPVKQSEVSKKAKEYTQKINKMRTAAKRSIKRQYPGDDSGAYKAMKADIDTKNLIKKAGGTGDIGFTAPDRKTKVAKRTTRAIKQGLPDPFDIDTSKASKEVAKDLKVPKKSDFKKLDKKPGGYRAPASEFGKSVTPGEFRSKQLSASAFRKTQPKDVKLPKSFTDFTKEIKNLKKSNKDISKKLSATPRTITIKQSEVSKQAKDFTTKVNQARTKKVTPTTTASKPKTTNVFKRVTAATSGKKVTNSKGIGNQFRGAENKAARDAEIIKRGGSVTGGGGKPPKPPSNVTFSAADFPDDNSRKIVKKFTGSRNVNLKGGTRPPRVVTKQTRALQSAQQTFAKSGLGKGLRKNLPQVYKGVRSLGPAGRAFAKTGVIGGAATIGTAFLAKNLLKKAAIGGVGGGILGGLAASQKQSDKERIKQMKKPVFKDEILDKKGKQKFPDSKKVVTTGLNLSDISKPKKKDKSRTAQSIKTETDYLKQRQKVAPYGAKYSG